MENLIKVTAELQSTIQLEQVLAARYVSIDSMIADEKKAINEARKANRENAEKLFKSIGLAVDSVTVANKLLPKRESKDANARKVAQRNRDWLKARLTAVYSDWGFFTTGSIIGTEYVGNEFVREARSLISSLNRINELCPDGKAVSEDSLVKALINESANTSGVKQVINDPETLAIKQAILDRLSAQMTAALPVGETAEQAAKVARKKAA